ncbi:MAG: S41 family peptidase [Anaerolineaceae bacterium]|nr:S41 family peptidase [Anaerolineaceae bacterium]
MNSKVKKTIMLTISALILLAGSFSGGVVVGWLIPDQNVSASADSIPILNIGKEESENPIDQTDDMDYLFSPFWQTWDIIHDDFVDQPVDDEKLMQGAINGMMNSLGDPHSSYMDPFQFEQSTHSMDGEYEGIGAWVDSSVEYLTIISPMPGSPAEEAGLIPNDQVLAIDGKSMEGISAEIALQSVLGPAGTDVTLSILREGENEAFDVTITRQKITIPSLVAEILDEEIAYVQLTTFGDNSAAELHSALNTVLDENPKGLILDLRNNGGGYLDTAIEVISEFVKQDQIVMYEEFGNGNIREFKSLPGGVATEIPLVVLINGGSASASEITAGAIQDFGRGVLVGTTTFGKGSVQNWIPLTNEQGAVRVTVARWLTPDKRLIHEIGLEPDFIVEFTEEDIENQFDSQLEKAIEVLLENK